MKKLKIPANGRLFLVCVGFLLTSLRPAHAQCTRSCGATLAASLTANGEHNLTVGVGSTIAYDWSSAYGGGAVSSYTVDGGLPNSWEADNLSGTVSGTIAASQVGHTYVITYKVTNSNGQTASDHVTITVVNGLTASLTANGLHSMTVGAGSAITYHWSSANALSAASSYTVDGGAANSWEANSLSGGVTGTIAASQVGHTYVITYTARNSTGQMASDHATITVVNSPTVSLIPNELLFSCRASAEGYYCNSPQIVNLMNTGPATLYLDGISFSENYFSQTNNCPSRLETGQSCAITVTFDETASRNKPGRRTYTGSLFITDSATPSTQGVYLWGETIGVP